MEELNINVSSFNEEEITQLLLKALKLSNEKSLRIKENVTKLEQQKRDDELEHEKSLLEKENTISLQSEKIQILEQDLIKSRNALQEQDENYQKSINELNGNHSAELQSKNKEIDEKTETIKQLCNEKNELSLTYESFKVDMFKLIFTERIEQLKQYCSLIENDANGLKQYIQTLTSKAKVLANDYGNVDSLCGVLLQPDGAISYTCNLIWWLNNDDIKTTYKKKIDCYDSLIVALNAIVELLKRFKYDLNIPIVGFCDTIPDYELYDNDISQIKDIFPDISISKSALCEIYSVSYNNKLGKCYSL